MLHLYLIPAHLRPDRTGVLHRARRRRLRRRLLAAHRRQGPAGGRGPRARARGDGSGLGGQPRLAHLRAHCRLDRLPDGLRVDRLHALDPTLHRRRRDHLPWRRLCAPRRGVRSTRARRNRHRLFDLVCVDPFRARGCRRRHRLRPRPRRQRRRQSVQQLAQPHVDPHRRIRRRQRRLHRRCLSLRRRDQARRPTARGAIPPARARRWRVAGVIAFAGLGVIADDAHRIFQGLTSGYGLAALIASLVAGITTLALVWRRQYERARYGAAVAVAAIIAGWALAQSPVFLPGLDDQSCRGAAHHFDRGHRRRARRGCHSLPLTRAPVPTRPQRPPRRKRRRPRAPLDRPNWSGHRDTVSLARAAVACLIAGIALLTVAEAPWAHALGVVSLLCFVALGFPAALPPEVVPQATNEAPERKPRNRHWAYNPRQRN